MAYVKLTGDNVASVDGRRQSRKFMNINDGRDLCLGLLPQMPIVYVPASLLVPVKIDRCLFFL